MNELMDIMREIASTGRYESDRSRAAAVRHRRQPRPRGRVMSDAQTTPTAAEAPNPPRSPKERAGRTPLMDFTQKWAGQIGITFAFVLLWVVFFLLAPDTFGRDLIYKSFGQTIPYFGIIAMMLTMVIVSGDIDLSFPSVMALGMVGFVWTWDATGIVLLAAIAAIGVGALAGLFNGLVITIVGLPSLVVTIGTQFLFRGLTLVLVGGSSYALACHPRRPRARCLRGQASRSAHGVLLVPGDHHPGLDPAQPTSPRWQHLRHRRQRADGTPHGHPHQAHAHHALRAYRHGRGARGHDDVACRS